MTITTTAPLTGNRTFLRHLSPNQAGWAGCCFHDAARMMLRETPEAVTVEAGLFTVRKAIGERLMSLRKRRGTRFERAANDLARLWEVLHEQRNDAEQFMRWCLDTGPQTEEQRGRTQAGYALQALLQQWANEKPTEIQQAVLAKAGIEPDGCVPITTKAVASAVIAELIANGQAN